MAIVLLSSMLPDTSAGRWLPAIAGYGTVLYLLGFAAVVSLPPAVARVAAVATLGVGFAGGAVAGRLSDDPAAARRNGVLVGVACGFTTAVLLRGTMSLALPRARWSAIWTLEYAIATGLGGVVSSDVAATYDAAIGIGIAAAIGSLVFVESIVGAVAAGHLGAGPVEGT